MNDLGIFGSPWWTIVPAAMALWTICAAMYSLLTVFAARNAALRMMDKAAGILQLPRRVEEPVSSDDGPSDKEVVPYVFPTFNFEQVEVKDKDAAVERLVEIFRSHQKEGRNEFGLIVPRILGVSNKRPRRDYFSTKGDWALRRNVPTKKKNEEET